MNTMFSVTVKSCYHLWQISSYREIFLRFADESSNKVKCFKQNYCRNYYVNKFLGCTFRFSIRRELFFCQKEFQIFCQQHTYLT